MCQGVRNCKRQARWIEIGPAIVARCAASNACAQLNNRDRFEAADLIPAGSG
jgi:hypothetical protein